LLGQHKDLSIDLILRDGMHLRQRRLPTRPH
jgi:hypothetical protein